MRSGATGTVPLTDRFPSRLSSLVPMPGLDAPGDRAWAYVDRGAAFQGSAWIESTWPPGLRAETLPYFKHQQWINRLQHANDSIVVMPVEGTANPPEISAVMAEVYDLLTTTPLET